MDVRCDKCQARYRIDDARVGAAGLTMRCGKCGNTFKVSKDGAAASTGAAPSKPPPKPAPAPAADDGAGSTMMFVAPKIPAPAPKAAPAAAPTPAAKPAPAADDGAGSTMMFVAPKIPLPAAKPAPAAPAPKPAAAAAKPAADDDSGSTMMFGSSPIKLPAAAPSAPPAPPPAKPAPAAAKPAPAPVNDDNAGSTMMFGSSPLAKPVSLPSKPAAPPPPKPPPPAPKKEEPPTPVAAVEPAPGDDEAIKGNAPAEDYGSQETAEEPAAGPRDTAQDEPGQAAPGESVGDDDIDPNALTSDASQLHGDEGEGDHAPAPKAPLPKGVIYGGIGAAAAIVLAVLGLLVANKFRPRPPPPAAMQALTDARAILDKDSISLFQQALDGDQNAIALAPKSAFPEAKALAAQIELAWSDALADESALFADKSSRESDDKKKADLDARSQKADAEAKVHHTNALEAVKGQTPELTKSPDVHLALADYYRQGKSNSFDKEIKKANALHANESAVTFLEGVKLLGDDDGAEKGLAKLKAALAADPGNARIQYRVAQAQFALKNDAEEKTALEATLKLSPQHERAKMMLDALVPPAPASPPSENTPENNK
jgi:predicted Zn finger-like uncharacterized protein